MGSLNKVEMRRHGDVLILTKSGFGIPEDVDLKPGTLIHRGGNNSHVFQHGKALMGERDGKRYLRVIEDGLVSHVGGSATHETKPLPKGDYWIEIQTFYDHLAEEAKQVVD